MRKEFILFATTAMLLSGPCWPVEPAETIPQQGASHPSASAIPDYVRAIQKRIRPVTNALVTEGDKSIEAVFPVEIDAEGNVLSIAVTTSSGDSKYDSAYMEAIRKVGMPRPTQGVPLKFNLVVRPLHSTRDWDYRPVIHAN